MRNKWTVVVVGLMLALALGGTATAAKFITSKDIKNGTIQAADLSTSAKNALRGQQGPAGPQGPLGPQGAAGSAGVSKPVVAASVANAAGDGWALFVDNTGNPQPAAFAIEVYCASGDAFVTTAPLVVAAGGADGAQLFCNPGDFAIAGGYYNATSPGPPARSHSVARRLQPLSRADRNRIAGAAR